VLVEAGIGSGFTLQTVNDSATLDLITLYSATRSERESRSAEQRAAHSRLMAASAAATDADGSELVSASQLLPAVKHLCRTVDAFVYVVNATLPPQHSSYLNPLYVIIV